GPAAGERGASSRERLWLDVREEGGGDVLERALADLGSNRPCALQQVAVAPETGKAEVGETGLTRAEQSASTAELEVDLGELETVARVAERLQPRVRRLGQLLLGA